MAHAPHRPQARQQLELGLVLALTLIVRFAVAAVFFDHLQDDPDAYARLAIHLAEHGEYSFGGDRPTAFRPPLYPLLLAPLSVGSSRIGVAALHVALGLLTVGCTWALARRWLPHGPAACLAALLVAFDPILLNQSTYVMTETCATALAALTLWLLDRWWTNGRLATAAVSGFGLALCTLCRPTFVVWLLLVLVWMACLAPFPPRRRWTSAGIALGVLVAVMSPWWIRNFQQFGRPVWTTTHGGYTLWLANNDSFFDYLAKGDRSRPWSSEEIDHAQMELSEELAHDELAVDREAARRGWETIGRRPATAVYGAFYRLGQFWNPWPQAIEGRPSGTALRVAVAVGYLAEFALAVAGCGLLLWSRQRLRGGPLWALCLALSAVHAVYWSNPRMRAPVIPAVAVLAAVGLARGLPRPNNTT